MILALLFLLFLFAVLLTVSCAIVASDADDYLEKMQEETDCTC